jgi:hypothetical protein
MVPELVVRLSVMCLVTSDHRESDCLTPLITVTWERAERWLLFLATDSCLDEFGTQLHLFHAAHDPSSVRTSGLERAGALDQESSSFGRSMARTERHSLSRRSIKCRVHYRGMVC